MIKRDLPRPVVESEIERLRELALEAKNPDPVPAVEPPVFLGHLGQWWEPAT